MAEHTPIYDSDSDSEAAGVDPALRAREEEALNEKALALKRRKTLQTYVLLGQMGNSSSILAMPSLSSESFTKK
jgi:hypothetical protein